MGRFLSPTSDEIKDLDDQAVKVLEIEDCGRVRRHFRAMLNFKTSQSIVASCPLQQVGTTDC